MGVHAFEEEFGGGDGGLGLGLGGDLAGGELFEEALDLLELFEEPAAACASLSWTVPPRLNHCSICWVLMPAK